VTLIKMAWVVLEFEALAEKHKLFHWQRETNTMSCTFSH